MKENRRLKLLQINFIALRDIIKEELEYRHSVIAMLQNHYDQIHSLAKGLQDGTHYMFCYSTNLDILSQRRSVTELEVLLNRVNFNIKDTPLVDEKEKPKDRKRVKMEKKPKDRQ